MRRVRWLLSLATAVLVLGVGAPGLALWRLEAAHPDDRHAHEAGRLLWVGASGLLLAGLALLAAGRAARGPWPHPQPVPAADLPPLAAVTPPTETPPADALAERLPRVIEHARRHAGYGFALLAIGVEEPGTELLAEIEQRLTHALRPGDLLWRRGDAGFFALLEGVADAAALAPIAERLQADLAEPCVVGCTPVLAAAAIGAVIHPAPGAEGGAAPAAAAETLRREAETALAEARGRGRWQLFDAALASRAQRASAMAGDLRQGLDEGGLFLVYQPVVQLATRSLVGVEALLRWRRPLRGLAAPQEFIAAAEECGLIDEVGAFVLDRACAQFMRWRSTLGTGAPRQLAVNLSRMQLLRPGLVPAVRHALHASGMRAEQLQLELTAMPATEDSEVQATLAELKSLGLRLALDGFGTDSASLACLRDLPLDTVKIDRSIVQRAASVEHHRVLIEATVRMARMLGITTVAVGVETAAQAALVRGLDCDRGQGHLFSPPLEALALEAWLRTHAGSRAADTV